MTRVLLSVSEDNEDALQDRRDRMAKAGEVCSADRISQAEQYDDRLRRLSQATVEYSTWLVMLLIGIARPSSHKQ